MKLEQICESAYGLKASLLMVVVQIAYCVMNVLYKLAAYNGMNLRVLIAYRFVFATAFMVPLALIIERKKRPKLTWNILFHGFLCGLFGGSLPQSLYVQSLALTSATLASAMLNLVPAITFVLAVCFRLEKLGFKTLAGKAKILGTLMGIGGAMVLTFYKGREVNLGSTNVDLLKLVQPTSGHVASSHNRSNHHVLGASLGVASCFCSALWLIIQAKMNKIYPCLCSSTAIMCVMGAIQAVAFGLWTENDWSKWKLSLDIRLLTVAYSGIVTSGLVITLTSWGVRLKGPLFVSVFVPLLLVLVAIAGFLFLDEKLFTGSILGSILIVSGLYVVLWGKGKDSEKLTLPVQPSESNRTDIVIRSTRRERDLPKTDHGKWEEEINTEDRGREEVIQA